MSVKLCKGCNTVKVLDTNFYKAGKINYQKLCKPCHNKKRYEYKFKKVIYIKRLTGFQKLPEDLQEKIKYDLYVKISYVEIAKKYNLNYQTLLTWKRSYTIPEYIENN